MTAVLDQVKNVAYTSMGVNLLVTDAIVGRQVAAPEFIGEHATIARKQATDALTEFRARTEPRAAQLEARLPEQVATVVASNRTKVWGFIGIDTAAITQPTKSTGQKSSKAAKKSDHDA